jgi:hypothetical protein
MPFSPPIRRRFHAVRESALNATAKLSADLVALEQLHQNRPTLQW